jgi:transcriptional regulator with XRE-family HTH domain
LEEIMGTPGRPRIRLEFPEELLRRYKSGEIDHHGVAEACGVSPNVALRELRRAGMDTSRSTRKQLQHTRRAGFAELYEAIPRLYGLGLSLREVAAQFGLTQEGVRQILLRRGVEIRPPQGRPRGSRRAEQAATRHFGRQLRKLRSEAGLTQGDLAERSGISRQTISILERGARFPAPETLARLCEALGVDADRFGPAGSFAASPQYQEAEAC